MLPERTNTYHNSVKIGQLVTLLITILKLACVSKYNDNSMLSQVWVQPEKDFKCLGQIDSYRKFSHMQMYKILPLPMHIRLMGTIVYKLLRRVSQPFRTTHDTLWASQTILKCLVPFLSSNPCHAQLTHNSTINIWPVWPVGLRIS